LAGRGASRHPPPLLVVVVAHAPTAVQAAATPVHVRGRQPVLHVPGCDQAAVDELAPLEPFPPRGLEGGRLRLGARLAAATPVRVRGRPAVLLRRHRGDEPAVDNDPAVQPPLPVLPDAAPDLLPLRGARVAPALRRAAHTWLGHETPRSVMRFERAGTPVRS